MALVVWIGTQENPVIPLRINSDLGAYPDSWSFELFRCIKLRCAARHTVGFAESYSRFRQFEVPNTDLEADVLCLNSADTKDFAFRQVGLWQIGDVLKYLLRIKRREHEGTP